MTSPDTDPDVAIGRRVAVTFLGSGDPGVLAPLGLPPAETAHFAGMMRKSEEATGAAAIVLGGAAHWLALQGNPAFGFGAASVVSDYWRDAVPPKSNPALEALIKASYASSFGGTLVTMAIACNRAGWRERTIRLAGEWEFRDPARIGGKPVAVHLDILAAEAHWLMRDFEAARRRIDHLEEPKEHPGAASLWWVLRHGLDELTQRAGDSEPSLPELWRARCLQMREQIERTLTLAPVDGSTPLGAERGRNIQILYNHLEQEAASPPNDDAELLRRLPGLMQAVLIIVNSARGPAQ